MSKELKKVELTLFDIYKEKGVTSFSEYSIEELVALEIETEKENLIANPSVAEIINKKRVEGYQIAFISDMYIGSTELRHILNKERCIEAEDKIYVSCEIQARKDSGLLYKHVKEELSPKHWEHYGDNLYSDIKIAKKNGIKAITIKTHSNSLEHRLEAISCSQPALRELSVIAGISRCARIIGNNPYAAIAANYVASTYIPFVKWTIETARKEGIKTLYFLSRDSYILLKIAESLPHEGIEFKYLYISRRSLMRPYMHNSSPENYLEIVDRHTLIGRDVEHMLWQLLTTEKDLKERYGIEFSYKRISDKKQEAEFIDVLYNSKFSKDFQKEIKEESDSLIEYLKQEEVTADTRKAFVDVGWLGTSRLMINSILERNGYKPVEFIYLGTRNDVYPCSYGKYYSYFPAGTLNTNMTSVIENYYSASPYPTTIGYKKTEEIYIPIFPENKSVNYSTIVNENVATSVWIAKEMNRYGIKDHNILSAWAMLTLDSLAGMKDNIDTTPFTISNDFDNEIFAKKLSFPELTNFLFFGKRITHFDYASLIHTCGFTLSHSLMRIHNITNKLRGYIFRRYIIRK
ncbi:MAG: hypothetical protein IJB01_10225 [Bacteroidaceae bacterium]|nr:hypothetical protein [Bacteroidaceae bacterium]